MTKERRLGRGLGSLLGQGEDDGSPAPARAEGGAETRPARARRAAPSAAGPGESDGAPAGSPAGSRAESAPGEAAGIGREIEIASVRRNPEQPRKIFNSEALEDLRTSIARHGVLQPITVRRAGKGYEIVAGERRWRAARAAGLERIPAIVREDMADDVSLELAIVENVQRQDLDPLEKARGYRALMERVGLSHADVADRVGLSRSAVTNQLRLLELPEKVQDALASGLISSGHARALLGIKDERQILRALEMVVRKDLSVRETEALGKGSDGEQAASRNSRAESRAKAPAPAWIGEMEARLREALGVKVSLKNGPKYRGTIQLEYANREELERLCDRLAPKDEL